MNKRWIKLLVPVVIVAVLAAGAGVYYLTQNLSTEEGKVANVELVDRGVQALVDQDQEALAAAVTDIEKQRDYEEVPEYLYVLAKYYSSETVNNLSRAEETAAAFKATEPAEYKGQMAGMRHADIVKGLENDLENLRAFIAGQSKEGEPTWGDIN